MENRIKIKQAETLADNYNTLKKITLDYQTKNGAWEEVEREVYIKDSGATILLYNSQKRTVILTKQFRIPIYLNENNKNGMAIEACAGLLEGLSPKETIIKETLEETGYQITDPEFLFSAYMVPGTVTEKVYFYRAAYEESQKITAGGGLAEEHEEIEVLELDFDNAFQMISTGEITDGKTIMLLQHAKIYNII